MAVNHDTPVVQLLRTAKLTASKLGLTDAAGWIQQELDGYPDGSPCPTYRMLAGECKAWNPFRGWIPTQFPTEEMHSLCSKGRVGYSLATLENMMADAKDSLYFEYPYNLQGQLQEWFNEDMKFAIKIPRAQVAEILETVRNMVLDWSLELERSGVLGENMAFTLTEKQEAQSVTQQFFIQNAGVVGNLNDNATVTNNQTVHGSLSVDRVRDLVQQAKPMLPALPSETASQASTLLDELDSESRKPSPDEGKLLRALRSLLTVCEGAAGNLVASGITAAVTALLT